MNSFSGSNPAVMSLLAGSLAIYLVSRFIRVPDDRESELSGVIAIAALCVSLWRAAAILPQGLLVNPEIGSLVIVITAAVSLYSVGYMAPHHGSAKFWSLLLVMAAGMLGVVFTLDLFSLYVMFELMSIASYALVTYEADRWEPVEAGFKYMMMNVTGTLLAVLGIALLFLSAGTLYLPDLAQASLADTPVRLMSMVLIILGFGVKAAIVPMHMWLPDAHTAAPTGVSAALSGIVVPVGLLGMVKVLFSAYATLHVVSGMTLVWLSAITMIVGNLAALTQTDIKRMLAYSSVVQTGYMLMGYGLGLAYRSQAGIEGALFHMITNASMKSLAFLSAGILITHAGSREMKNLRGAGREHPWAGAGFAVACLSLAGVPPLAGFMSKLLIYRSGFEAGGAIGYLMSALAILLSVVSLGYYLPAVALVFQQRAEETATGHSVQAGARLYMHIPVLLLALTTMLLGIYPGRALAQVASVLNQVIGTLAK